MFLPLSRAEIKKILRLLMRKVEKRLGKQGLVIKLSEAALDHLGDLGYDPQFGARPMKRVLQREITNPLAAKVLSSEFIAGDTIYVDLEKGELTFSKTPFEEVKKKINEAVEVVDKVEEVVEEAVPKRSRRRGGKKKTMTAEEHQKQVEELEKATKDVIDEIEKTTKKK